MKNPLSKLPAWLRLPQAMVLCALMMLMHVALSGSRVTVMLNAVELGMSKFQVGLLIASFALLPMVLAIAAGRRIDAKGSFRPMRLAAIVSAVGVTLPLLFQHWIALAAAAMAVGIGHMAFQIATQGLLGQADPVERLRNFAWLSMAMAVSGFSGPLIAGLAIDHLGHRWSYLMLCIGPLIALWGTRRMRTALLNRHTPKETPPTKQRARDLLRIQPLRYVLGANLLLASAWDTHNFLVPLYGVERGFSATTIGLILATFALATFVIRIFLPVIQKRARPWQMIHFAMISTGIYFMSYPWFSDAWVLMGLSFMLGLSLGSTQPSILSLLQEYAPHGRKAEAFGVRTALINGSQVSLPIGFGALGSLLGIFPLFWATALALMAGVWATRRGGRYSELAPLITEKDRNDRSQS